MAAGRHNLSRRALLGVGVGACAFAGEGRAPAVPFAPGSERRSSGRSWERAVTALRRAEARVAAFEAEEALLSVERRALACDALEERFGRLDSLRLAAVRRLLRLPAADLPALVLKLDIAVGEQAWEDSGSEDCLTVIAADARRISENAASWEPENGN
jgi:hypothetical protein